MAKRFAKGEMVQLLDHIELPYEAINRFAEYVHRDGYHIGVIVRDDDGDVMYISRRTDGLIYLPREAIRRLSPLEQLALAAEDTSAKTP